VPRKRRDLQEEAVPIEEHLDALTRQPAATETPTMSDTRIEKDSLGEVQVPADAYYGAQTERARRQRGRTPRR
jgi:hypothetical protein